MLANPIPRGIYFAAIFLRNKCKNAVRNTAPKLASPYLIMHERVHCSIVIRWEWNLKHFRIISNLESWCHSTSSLRSLSNHSEVQAQVKESEECVVLATPDKHNFRENLKIYWHPKSRTTFLPRHRKRPCSPHWDRAKISWLLLNKRTYLGYEFGMKIRTTWFLM